MDTQQVNNEERLAADRNQALFRAFRPIGTRHLNKNSRLHCSRTGAVLSSSGYSVKWPTFARIVAISLIRETIPERGLTAGLLADAEFIFVLKRSPMSLVREACVC